MSREEEQSCRHNQGSAARADESAETAKWVFISYSHARSNSYLFFFPRWIYFWISFVVILSGEGGGEIGWRAPLLPDNWIIVLEKQALTPSWQQAEKKKQCDAI